jgi:hypothetical protein
MTPMDKLKEQFVNSGYVELDKSKTPKSLLWQPDLLFSKDGYTYLVLVKSNNSVPPTFLNRIGDTPKGNFIPLIIFSHKPTVTDEKSISSLGISTGIFSKGKLSHLNIKKKLSTSEVRKKNKGKLEVIDIFISSKQDIEERKFVEDRIENLRKINSYPFSPPHLIEYDRFDIKNLYKHIDSIMSKCEWIVILLEDSHSKVVRYEINKAIKIIDHKNIFMFVKSTIACQTAWKSELKKIKDLESKSIKYLPYSDRSELEVYLSKAIKTRINEICKKKNIEIFA